jgi:hypothetical protein
LPCACSSKTRPPQAASKGADSRRPGAATTCSICCPLEYAIALPTGAGRARFDSSYAILPSNQPSDVFGKAMRS